ncbi:MAG TPA: hypothetical protein DCE23_04500 [Firmicutes bacterium]|nr:hypothetical protein [Bacillota bacterium]
MQEKALRLLIKLDKIYEDVVNGDRNFISKLDNLLIEILNFTEEEIKDEIISMVIIAFNHKVNLIYKICPIEESTSLTFENLQEEFKILEIKQFEINNNYVLGTINIKEIDDFREKLFTFRNRLYAIPISDSNILEIAKMKSKIQHYETEILEDEDVLSMAYANSN